MGLVEISYLARHLGFHTNIVAILPEEQGTEPCPVLYLLHGGGGNAMEWLRNTNVQRTAQAHGVAVVMPEVGGSCFYTDMAYGYNYFSYLSKELPLVAQHLLPVSADRSRRYVAGLSMGGYGAFKWAMKAPGFFAAAGNFSGAAPVPDMFLPGAFAGHEAQEENGVVKLCWGGLEGICESGDDSLSLFRSLAAHPGEKPYLFIGTGTVDMSYELIQQYRGFAAKSGLEIDYDEMPGGHDWPVWDEMLDRFLANIQSRQGRA